MIDSTLIQAAAQNPKAILSSWPVLVAIFTMGSTWAYIKFSLKSLENKIDGVSQSITEQRESMGQEIKDHETQEDELETKMVLINNTLIKIQTTLENTSEVDKTMRDQVTICFNELKDIREKFVSVEHMRSVTDPLREDIRALQSKRMG